MNTAQHERIELTNSKKFDRVIIQRTGNAKYQTQLTAISGLELEEDCLATHAAGLQTWDSKGLEALALCLNCFRQTGSFKSLRDNEAALFVGGKVRQPGCNRVWTVLHVSEHSAWLIEESSDARRSVDPSILQPVVYVPPKVRPYTPREAVEFLGREMHYRSPPKGHYALIEVGLTHVLVGGAQGYETYENLAIYFTWADTGEPCGVIEEDTNA